VHPRQRAWSGWSSGLLSGDRAVPNLDSRCGNCVEVSLGWRGSAGGKRKQSVRPCHQCDGGFHVGEGAVDADGWWLGRLSARVSASLVMCRVPPLSRKSTPSCRDFLVDRSGRALLRSRGSLPAPGCTARLVAGDDDLLAVGARRRALQAGLALSQMGLAVTLSGPIAGRLSERPVAGVILQAVWAAWPQERAAGVGDRSPVTGRGW
jgi:hypothetical protein